MPFSGKGQKAGGTAGPFTLTVHLTLQHLVKNQIPAISRPQYFQISVCVTNGSSHI